MSLVDIQFQASAMAELQRSVAQNRLSHALIFHGPSGVGRRKMAIALAEAILCEKPVLLEWPAGAEVSKDSRFHSSCGRCDDCRGIQKRNHPDLHVIHRRLGRLHPDPDVRRRKGLDLSVDVIRHFIIDRAGITSIRGRAKFFIVEDAETMSVAAQNSLLKTLEEPPPGTYIILIVDALESLLATTLSRCQTVEFGALPDAFVEQVLRSEQTTLSEEALQWYSHWSSGSIGEAVTALSVQLFEKSRAMKSGLVALCFTKDRGDDGIVPEELTKDWTQMSEKLAAAFKESDADLGETEVLRLGLSTVMALAAHSLRDSLTGEAAQARWAMDAICRIARAQRQIDWSANVSLCVETLVNDLARTKLGR